MQTKFSTLIFLKNLKIPNSALNTVTSKNLLDRYHTLADNKCDYILSCTFCKCDPSTAALAFVLFNLCMFISDFPSDRKQTQIFHTD